MRTLVIQLARFGDLVQTKRLLRSLLCQPGDEVHLCLDQSLSQLAQQLYPEVELHAVCAHGSGLTKLSPSEQAAASLGANLPVFKRLSGITFDRVYNLNFSPLNFRIAGLFDPDCVRGHVWRDGQEEVGQWARLAMRWSSMRRIGLNIADFWAWHLPTPMHGTEVNPPALGRGGGLGVVMAGRESRRSLPPRELASFVAGLLETQASLGGKPVVLFGTAAEGKAASQLVRELPAKHVSGVRNLCGATDWETLIAEVGQLDLLLTPDTGTMHLAAALGVPVLATFLSSAWCTETGPYGVGHRVLQATTECLPCLESQPCEIGVACLQPFTPGRATRYLATNNAKHLPEGLIDFESCIDGLGIDFNARAGDDVSAGARARFRIFLARHLCAGGGWQDVSVHEFAERLYCELDWMAPDAESSTGRHHVSIQNYDHDNGTLKKV